MKVIAPISSFLLAGIILLLPDTTWQTVLITALPWLGFVFFALRQKTNPKIPLLWAALWGLGYALYLQWSWSQGEVPQCSSAGCSLAQSSEYADMFFGLRTSLVGVIGYSLFLLSLLLRGNTGLLVGSFLAAFGFGISLFLSYSSVAVLGTTCQWCLGSAAAMTTLFVLSWWRMWREYS